MTDLVVEALAEVTRRAVRRRELARDPGRYLRWVELGDGPAAVLVAGTGGTVLDWTPIMSGVAAAARVVAYDRAGSGASDPMATMTIAAEIEDLAALLEATGPAVVVGHSWGGLLVQLTALQHPTLFRGLVLVDSTYETVLRDAPRLLRVAEKGVGNVVVILQRCGLFKRLAATQGRKIAAASTENTDTQQIVVDAYLDAYSHTYQVAMIRDEARMMYGGVSWIAAQRANAALPDVPLVALTATKKPSRIRQLSSSASSEVCASVSRGRQVVVDGSGHYIHHDDPTAVVEAVVGLLGAEGVFGPSTLAPGGSSSANEQLRNAAPAQHRDGEEDERDDEKTDGNAAARDDT